MAGMSPPSLRHDVKLGLLLVVAALLLDMGSSGVSWLLPVSDQLGRTPMALGLLGPVIGIGSLFVVLAANPGAAAIRNWDFDIPAGWFALGLALVGGMVLYTFLPRRFTNTYGPGPTFRETIAPPGVKGRFASTAIAYLVSAVILAAGTTHLRWITAAAEAAVGADYDTWHQTLALAVGIGALVWGAAADFFAVRWLLIAVAALSLPAAAWLRQLHDPVGGALLLSLVRGGLISLPWVLAADLLTKRHFAKLALVMVLLGMFGSSLGSLYQGAAMAVWGTESFIWIVLIESIVLTVAVAWQPTNGRFSSRIRWRNNLLRCEGREQQ